MHKLEPKQSQDMEQNIR